MTFFGRHILSISVGIGLVVGLWGYADIGKKSTLTALYRSDEVQSNSGGDVLRISSWSVVGGGYHRSWLLQMMHWPDGLQRMEQRDHKRANIIVDPSGCGDTRTVQAAVDAVADGNTHRVVIHIHAGIYTEKVRVPSNKPFITFQGQGLHETVITWNDNASKTNSTFTTASVAVEADYFIAHNISFKNTAPKPGPNGIGAQAIALQVVGDKNAFYGCGMFGYQDTLNDHQGRHLFRDCHIEGRIDFIFGNARSLYQRCTIMSNAEHTGAITAQSRLNELQVTGFGFVQCSITGTGRVLLGRAWRSYARVVFASTYMEDIVDGRGWDDWRNKSADMTVFYGEYNNSGPGANMAGRVAYARALSSKEAAKFTQIAWINGSDWLPKHKYPTQVNQFKRSR